MASVISGVGTAPVQAYPLETTPCSSPSGTTAQPAQDSYVASPGTRQFSAQTNAVPSGSSSTWTQAQIQALSASDIASLTQTQVQGLSATQFGWFSGTQWSEFSTTQVKWFSATQIGGIADASSGFTTALYEKVRIDGQVVSNAVVIAYAVTASGYRDVVAIDVVDTECKESWSTFLRALRKRGLTGTKLVISDAHEGLKAAIATVMQGARWQRCKLHFYRNVLAHVPQSRKLEFAAAMKVVFSQVSRDGAQRAISDLHARFAKTFAKAVAIFDAGIEDVLAFIDFPLEHHRKISSNNPIEHLNKEIRRRTRSIGIFPNVASALRLVTTILVEQSEDWMIERRYMSPESLELGLQG